MEAHLAHNQENVDSSSTASIKIKYASIAQLVVRLTCNENVGGSNPSRGFLLCEGFWGVAIRKKKKHKL